MPKTLYMIHTVSGVLPLFNSLAEELMPEVKRYHIADEALLRVVLAHGGLTPSVYRRLTEDVIMAHEAGADLILVTCSSISPAVDVVQKAVPIPVLKIDVPMVDKAIATGKHIAVLATAPTTLKPTSELVKTLAAEAGKPVTVDAVLAEGAYDHLMSNNLTRHDEIIVDYLRRLQQQVDVIILAQASMARALDTLPAAERKVPMLTSPRMGMEQTRDAIRAL